MCSGDENFHSCTCIVHSHEAAIFGNITHCHGIEKSPDLGVHCTTMTCTWENWHCRLQSTLSAALYLVMSRSAGRSEKLFQHCGQLTRHLDSQGKLPIHTPHFELVDSGMSWNECNLISSNTSSSTPGNHHAALNCHASTQLQHNIITYHFRNKHIHTLHVGRRVHISLQLSVECIRSATSGLTLPEPIHHKSRTPQRIRVKP